VVYTRRSPLGEYAPSGYRVTAAFKCGPGTAAAKSGFQALYRRVRSLADNAIAEKACCSAEEAPLNKVLCHGWRTFGEKNVSAAFIMLELRRPPFARDEQFDKVEPTERDFLEPGGSSLEEISLINPQRADEFYNEFDFTQSSSDSDLVTLSHGEHIPASTLVNFEASVRRAEKEAERYYTFLRSQGETTSRGFRIIHKEWFLANKDFVTVHVCFER
jgi:hypothetical protein